MLSVVSKSFARRSMPMASRSMSQQMMDVATIENMKKSKKDFVHFVNKATLDEKSAEKQAMYNFLVGCFTDNDTDYDGQVSYRGFNQMVGEAAQAPRRFGFAPHTREMYNSKEEYEKERMELFDQLRGSNERVTMENWLGWANAHIKQKVGSGLDEHNESKWERSKGDYVEFIKGVLQAHDKHNIKASTSTQKKECYLLAMKQFAEADEHMRGILDAHQFENLKKICAAVPGKHGIKMYSEWKMSDLTQENYVTLKDFMDYQMKYLKMKADSM